MEQWITQPWQNLASLISCIVRRQRLVIGWTCQVARVYFLMLTTRLNKLVFVLLSAISLPAAAQDRNIGHCLSISDVNDRIDCLENGGAPSTSTPGVRFPKQSHAGPSFNCRAAGNSVERAICADATLAEWDYRMGQQYQHALRIRKEPDARLITESQRAWITQRNAHCNTVSDIAISTCVLDMTRQRTEVLAKLVSAGGEAVATAQSRAATQAAPQNSSNTANTSSKTSTPLTSPTPMPIPSTNPSSNGPNSLFVLLFAIAAVIGGAIVVGNISRKNRLAAEAEAAQHRLAEEQQRRAEERQRLVAKYGETVADGILRHQVWQGMTEEQLLESWGNPEDRDIEIKRATKKETWKYGEIGKNRFSDRVFLENGIVIGWKQQ